VAGVGVLRIVWQGRGGAVGVPMNGREPAVLVRLWLAIVWTALEAGTGRSSFCSLQNKDEGPVAAAGVLGTF
jgi:hypothetical protein